MKKEEKTLQNHFSITHKLLLIGCVIMLSSILFQHTSFFWIPWVLGFLIMVAGVLYAIMYCRCPYCGTRLDTRGKVPIFCPNCGKRLL